MTMLRSNCSSILSILALHGRFKVHMAGWLQRLSTPAISKRAASSNSSIREGVYMMIPTIHLNGTSRDALLSELESAHAAIGAAIGALRQVTVHGRDYYVQSDCAYALARHEMDVRLTALKDIANDVLTMHINIRSQR